MLPHQLSEKIISELEEIFQKDICSVILFGSYAKGTAQTYSDIDILIILNRLLGSGGSMTKPLDIAKAMLIEANNDYEVVHILIENGKYNLEDAVIPLEESWTNSRYPDWSVEPIWIPSQQYTLDNAIQI